MITLPISNINSYNNKLYNPTFQKRISVANSQWNKIAGDWIEVKRNNNTDILNKSITYPELKRLMGNVKGKKVLDLGCGEGYSSRQMAEYGAEVTGIDFSPKLINRAKEINISDSRSVNYLHGDMTNLNKIADGSQDKVVSVMSFMYLNTKNIEKALLEAKRVLKDDGELIIVTKHPFTTRNNLSNRAENPHTMNYLESYFRKKVFSYTLNLNNICEKLPIYPQTVSSMYNLIKRSGFEVTEMSEPAPIKAAMERYKGNPHLEFYNNNPMILCIKAKKKA